MVVIHWLRVFGKAKKYLTKQTFGQQNTRTERNRADGNSAKYSKTNESQTNQSHVEQPNKTQNKPKEDNVSQHKDNTEVRQCKANEAMPSKHTKITSAMY